MKTQKKSSFFEKMETSFGTLYWKPCVSSRNDVVSPPTSDVCLDKYKVTSYEKENLWTSITFCLASSLDFDTQPMRMCRFSLRCAHWWWSQLNLSFCSYHWFSDFQHNFSSAGSLNTLNTSWYQTILISFPCKWSFLVLFSCELECVNSIA